MFPEKRRANTRRSNWFFETIVALAKGPVESLRRKRAWSKKGEELGRKLIGSRIDIKEVLVPLLLDQAHGLKESIENRTEAEF